ncbi:hypothetical protein [Streptomyces sp. NPDC023838]|uniref:hypothetical protein n=1 Tax=Streptomyces sp. NPDC023838 TaxID=3154325 RepID=UPI0033EE1577
MTLFRTPAPDTGGPDGTEAGPCPVQPRHAPPRHHGLALRFVLVIGEARLADAHHVSCVLDTVRAEFPETSIRIRLSLLSSAGRDGTLLLECHAEHRPADGRPQAPSATWQRVLTGRPGAPHQREALLHEILAGRTRAVVRRAPVSLRYLAAAV